MEQKMQPREGFRKLPTSKYNFREIRENVLIEDMANALGIHIDNKGYFKAPCHDDTKPSATIVPNKGNSNRCQSWHCFTCNITGSVIDFVAYATGNAEFENDGPRKGRMTLGSIIAACDVIAQYHPEIVHDTEKEATFVPINRPQITRDLIKELGLESNPYFKTRVRFDDPAGSFEESKKPEKERKYPIIADEIVITETEATLLLLDKIEERADKYVDFEQQVFKAFPGLDAKAREEITKETNARIKALLEKQKEVLNYLKTIAPEIFLEAGELEESEKEDR